MHIALFFWDRLPVPEYGGTQRMVVALARGLAADVPWIRGLAGNWKPGTTGAPNTLYLSRDHARRHGGTAFVYNGVDPAEYRYRRNKDDYDLFLGRLHAAKGYRWAAAAAKRLRRRMLIAGGWRPSLSRYVRYVGAVGGERKAELLAGARAFWMPAL